MRALKRWVIKSRLSLKMKGKDSLCLSLIFWEQLKRGRESTGVERSIIKTSPKDIIQEEKVIIIKDDSSPYGQNLFCPFFNWVISIVIFVCLSYRYALEMSLIVNIIEYFWKSGELKK